MIRLLAIGIFIMTGIAGCSPSQPDVFLSNNHPAEPTAPAGRPIALSAALRPELQQASPRLLRAVPGRRGRNFALPPRPKPTAPTSGGHDMRNMPGMRDMNKM